MLTSIIRIGNSKGVRIPKYVLVVSKIQGPVYLEAYRGEIRIIPAHELGLEISSSIQNYEQEWFNPIEEKAWVGGS